MWCLYIGQYQVQSSWKLDSQVIHGNCYFQQLMVLGTISNNQNHLKKIKVQLRWTLMDPCIIHNSRGSSRKTIAPRTIEPRRSIPQRARWLTFAGANAFAREGMQTFGIKIPIALPCPCSVTSFYDSRAVCDQIFIDPNRKPIARECKKLGQSSRIDVKGKSPDARMDDEGVKISADSRSDTIMQRSCVCVWQRPTVARIHRRIHQLLCIAALTSVILITSVMHTATAATNATLTRQPRVFPVLICQRAR